MAVGFPDIDGLNESLINAVKTQNYDLAKDFLARGANSTAKVNGVSAVRARS